MSPLCIDSTARRVRLSTPPGVRFTQERREELDLNPDGFLWPEEVKLATHVVHQQERVFAWTEQEKGCFSPEYFDPVLIPTVEHVPWVLRNIPIPPSIYKQVIDIVKSKIAAGVYEPSNSSYRSRWFWVLKKDGKSLRLVHDLQPLNAVTIRDPALPPFAEQLGEQFAGQAVYTVFDLFVAFDQRQLHPRSRDLTTFQTPLGTFRLTSLPMGYTNSPQVLQNDINHILRDEIPTYTQPFADDIPVKSGTNRYVDERGQFETIIGNAGI